MIFVNPLFVTGSQYGVDFSDKMMYNNNVGFMPLWWNRQTQGTLMFVHALASVSAFVNAQRVPVEKSIEQKSAKTAKAQTERRANPFG